MEALNYNASLLIDGSDDDDEGGDDSVRCDICFERSMNSSNSVKLKCGHRFHLECLVSAYKKQGGTSKKMTKQCQYCRTTFKYIPYMGGEPVKGLHDPAHVAAYQKQCLANPEWGLMMPNRHLLYVIRGKYRYRKGLYQGATEKMVTLVLEDGDGRAIRTTKNNVLSVTENTPQAIPEFTNDGTENGQAGNAESVMC